jgi:hypothetical protein
VIVAVWTKKRSMETSFNSYSEKMSDESESIDEDNILQPSSAQLVVLFGPPCSVCSLGFII